MSLRELPECQMAQSGCLLSLLWLNVAHSMALVVAGVAARVPAQWAAATAAFARANGDSVGSPTTSAAVRRHVPAA